MQSVSASVTFPDVVQLSAVSHLPSPSPIKVYKIRWFYVLVASLLHISLNFTFLTLASVANYADSYYGKGTTTTNGIVFLAVSSVASPFAIWLSRKVGLRWVILIGVAIAALGTGIRCVSLLLPSNSRCILLFVGQAVASIAFPMATFLPPKVAAVWFPSRQRALATSLVAVSAPLGILLINLIGPAMVKDKKSVVGLVVMVFVFCLASFVLALIVIRRSAPKHAPSVSASGATLPFWVGLKKCMTTVPFLLLCLCLGGGIGLFNTLYTNMEQFLCTKGYSNQFSGLCISLMMLGGIIFASAAGVLADKTKLFDEILKVSLIVSVFIGILFNVATQYANEHVLLALFALLNGAIGTVFYAIGLEMSAECTYPVEETTTAGILNLSATIQGVVYLFVFKFLAKPINSRDLNIQVCTVSESGSPNGIDARTSLFVFNAIGIIYLFVFVPFFKPKYKRMSMDQTETVSAES